MDILIDLFLKFLKIGAFSYGGGYTALSLIEREIVYNSNYLTVNEFLVTCWKIMLLLPIFASAEINILFILLFSLTYFRCFSRPSVGTPK